MTKKQREVRKARGRKSLPAGPDEFDELVEFEDSLNAETDRGAALVSAAYLEEELKRLLQKYFIDDPKLVEQLFDASGPLATFSGKITLAYASGLIPPDTHAALHLIRKIRNSFAHEHRERRFTDQDISAQCRALLNLSPFPKQKNPRQLFSYVIGVIVSEIQGKIRRTTHKPINPSMDPGSKTILFNALEALLAKFDFEARKDRKTRADTMRRVHAEVTTIVEQALEELLKERTFFPKLPLR